MTELNRGTLKIVDLTQPLGPATPVIGLPPMFASSPGLTVETISRYDAKGPAWYWNTLTLGEHTGTHFDAPIHWVTGQDLPENACDTSRRFAQPGLRRAHVHAPGPRPRHPRRRRRDHWNGRGAGRHVRTAVPEPHDHARRRPLRPCEPVQPRSAAAHRRRRHRRAAQDRRRQRQSGAGDRDAPA